MLWTELSFSVPTRSDEEIVLSTQAVPITFTTPSAVLRFQPWNFQKYSKLDIRFMTREKRGILFFVGSASANHDCIGVDIFNSNLYVYGILNGKEFRVQMNPVGSVVSNGKSYNVAIQMLPTNYITMLFDGVPNPKTFQAPAVLEFDSYTYIGGIDSTYRLPWIAYSQVGFAGSIEYIRINDDKFIDANKFPKQTEMQGVKTGVIQTPEPKCVFGMCAPGKCHERSYNLKDESKNFYCDCSGTFKTYSSMATDILRGETCIRDATPFECDRKSFILFDFDVVRLTHTDDISIDFKTLGDTEPIFFAKSAHGDEMTSFMSADLILGQMIVAMKLHGEKDDSYKKVLALPIGGLNDGKWHTLKIARYVQEVTVYVDHKKNIAKGILYRSAMEKFYNNIREIFVGSNTFKPGNDKCTGALKNFYWNEFDLLNTRNYVSRYKSQVISEKPQLPELPPFPRQPPNPCAIKPHHQKTLIENVTVSANSAMFLIEVKTKYNGVVYYAEIPNQLDDWFTVLIFENSVLVPYHIGSAKGMIGIELTRGGINIRDNSWHRIIVELSKIKSSITVFVDDVKDLTKEVIFPTPLQNIQLLTFSVGGFSELVQFYKMISKIKEFSPSIMSSFSDIDEQKFVGCLGELLTNDDNFSKNLMNRNSVVHSPPDSVYCRACEEMTKCPNNYCQNLGKCYNIDKNKIACNCTGTNFYGPSCDIKNPTCLPGDCINGGLCTILGSVKACNCTGTGFTGVKCEVNRCTNFICQNKGICRLINGQPMCDCTGTSFSGVYCDQPDCPADFCQNKAHCKLDNATQLPYCDCKGTGYTGVRCDKEICPKNQCNGNGNCVIRVDKPVCYCFDDYTGINCETPVCSKGYCLNGGRCFSSLRKPTCTCTVDFIGERCEKPKPCPQSSCLYGGSCTMVAGQPVCNCSLTDYFGTQCQTPKSCPDSYCKNSGKCSVVKNNFVCDCSNTGYSGSLCNDKLGCPDGFCKNGGVCSNTNGPFVCDCSQTGYGGDKCDQQSQGMVCPYYKPGYPVKTFRPPKLTDQLATSLGFQTWAPSGTIFCYETVDDKYWSAKLMEGRMVIDINGVAFNMKTRLDDGKYHLLKITQQKKTFIVTLDFPVVETLIIPLQLANIMTLPDNLMAYKKLIFCNSCPDTEAQNQFQGSIGGARSGSDSIADQFNSSSVALIGPVATTLVPMKPLPKPTMSRSCTSGYCKNGGQCKIQLFRPFCDCGITGYEGEFCQKRVYIIRSMPPNPGYVIHNLVPPEARNFDIWRFLSSFVNVKSPLATFILSDGNYIEFKYVNGRIEVTGTDKSLGFLNDIKLDRNAPHFFKIQHMLGRMTMFVNKTKTGAVHLPDTFLMPNGSIKVVRIIVGANKNLDETIKGYIGGYMFNSKPLLFPNGTFLPTALKIETIIVEPWIVFPKKMPQPPDDSRGTHGGMVYINGRSIYGNAFGAGGIVPTGTGPVILGAVISMAGGVLPISNMALGFGAAALLLISAIIWSLCYLGLIKYAQPPMYGGAALAAGKTELLTTPLLLSERAAMQMSANGSMKQGGMNTMDIAATSPSTFRLDLNQTNNQSLATNNTYAVSGLHPLSAGFNAGAGFNTVSGFSTKGYSDVNYLTVPNLMSAQMNGNGNFQTDMSNDRVQESKSKNIFSTSNFGNETAMMNTFNDDENKIESCLLSDDSRFAVTGSVSGPPQIWDMSTGDLIRIMNGGDMAYTSLQLALNCQFLIGLVKENQQSSNVKKLTVWNFKSGEVMDLREKYFCTTFCMSSDSISCVLADESIKSAINILNLKNAVSRKILYNQQATLANEGIQFLKITNNNEYVVAGSRHAFNQSCYLIFNLLSHFAEEPKRIDVNSVLQSCELINDTEMVIGTDVGELVIWNLRSGESVRQILISSSADGVQKRQLNPHENSINCITVSKDRSIMVTGGADTKVNVWQMKTETLMQSFTKHEDEIKSVALTLDNEMLITGSWDGSIRTWNVQSGQEMCTFLSSIEITKVLISNDKTVVVALGERAGVNKLVMLKIVRNVSKVVTTVDQKEIDDRAGVAVVSPPL